jgi:hypothetical protein
MLLKAPLVLDRKSTGSEYVLIKARAFKIVQNYVLWKFTIYRGTCHVWGTSCLFYHFFCKINIAVIMKCSV